MYSALCFICGWSLKQQVSVPGNICSCTWSGKLSKPSFFFEFPTIWAAVIDAVSEKLTRPCVVHICVYIYVSKWSCVWASEFNEKQLACVWSSVFSELVEASDLFSVFCPSACLELIRESDYRTDTTCWCRAALSSVPDTQAHTCKTITEHS